MPVDEEIRCMNLHNVISLRRSGCKYTPNSFGEALSTENYDLITYVFDDYVPIIPENLSIRQEITYDNFRNRRFTQDKTLSNLTEILAAFAQSP